MKNVIKRLQLDDICRIVKIDNLDVCYYKSEYSDLSTSNVEITRVKLDKYYESKMNDTLLNKLFENICEKETDLNVDFKWIKTPTKSENNNLINALNIAKSLIVLNNNYDVSKFCVIVDDEYFDILNISKLYYTNFYFHKNFGEKIIVIGIDDNCSNDIWTLFVNNNKYCFEEVGNFSKRCQVINLNCKQLNRIKKLNRIYENFSS